MAKRPEFGDSRNPLKYESATEFSDRWTSLLRAKVILIQDSSLDSADKIRALRGIIVGDICGDAVGPLYGAMLQIIAGELKEVNRTIIYNDIAATWLTCVRSVYEFQSHLPQNVFDTFENIFQQYGDFASQIRSNSPMDLTTLSSTSQELLDKFHTFGSELQGFDKNDSVFARNIIHQLMSE